MHKTSQWHLKIAILHQTPFWQRNLTVDGYKVEICFWEMFLIFDPRFRKEESRSGFGRRPSMVCNVRYQAPSPQAAVKCYRQEDRLIYIGRLGESNR